MVFAPPAAIFCVIFFDGWLTACFVYAFFIKQNETALPIR